MFTLSLRRHHCRLCGVLCCDLCSNKKLFIKPLLGLPITGNKLEKDRVCDCCFNKLNSDVIHWHIVTTKIKKEQEKAELLRAKDSPTKTNRQSDINSNDKNKVESVKSVMSDTMKVLSERGEKIQELADKGEEIREVFYY